MDPAAVLRWLRSLGGTPRRVLIVGCEPARTEEEIGLSEPVAAAVQPAIDVILRLAREAAGGETTSPGV
jgi:hydrogenase maturation protease